MAAGGILETDVIAPVLRPFNAWDEAIVMSWLEKDKPGLEEVFGAPLPTKEAFVEIFAHLFEAQQEFKARLLLVEYDGAPIGFVAVTEIPPNMDYAKGHIFIEPAHRRHSLAAIQAGVDEAKRMGLKALFLTIFETNRAALLLAKRAGFQPTGVVTFKQEL